MTPAEYLKEPYGRVVVPDSDGTFRAEIIEFPGCIATGDTAAEALANLENVAESWLDVVLAKGQHIPEPIENGGFSGKLVVRLPKTLHKKAAHMAARDGVSLNHFIVTSIAEQVGNRSAPYVFGHFQSILGGATAVTNIGIHTGFGPPSASPYFNLVGRQHPLTAFAGIGAFQGLTLSEQLERRSNFMPEVNQIVFGSRELLELLMREAKVTEGRWILMANFGIAPANFGASPDQMSPGVAVAINQVGIQRAAPDTPEGMGLDAAEIGNASKLEKQD